MEEKHYRPLPSYLSIGPSDIHGAGIIAKEDIPKDIVIGVTHVYHPDFKDDLIRTPLGGFLNHSEKSNCRLFEPSDHPDWKKIITTRAIEAGEELTLCYEMYNPSK